MSREHELRRAVIDARVATGDALLYALELAAVVGKLRAVAPDLVEAAELEVRLEGLR